MRNYVVEGNTVRAIEREYRMPRNNASMENVIQDQTKTAHMNPAYVAFLILMAGVLFVGCTMYINLRSSITERQKAVERLQSELSAKKLANDEEYDRIVGSVDMEEIKKVAMNELHMKYPDSGQVSTMLGNDETDYVRQYKEIPK
ncbi:MAG: cell division protein FtsL [Lachnospiraceae bacterium]|nr:cell division protein FtsL [Lachnospiraceae bacterium]